MKTVSKKKRARKSEPKPDLGKFPVPNCSLPLKPPQDFREHYMLIADAIEFVLSHWISLDNAMIGIDPGKCGVTQQKIGDHLRGAINEVWMLVRGTNYPWSPLTPEAYKAMIEREEKMRHEPPQLYPPIQLAEIALLWKRATEWQDSTAPYVPAVNV